MLTDQMASRMYSLLRLLTAKGIGPAKSRQIMEVCRNNDIPLDELFKRIDMNSLLPKSLIKYTDTLKKIDERLFEQLKQLSGKNIHAVIYDEEEYPQRLLDALGDKAPIALFYIGNLEISRRPAVGFCGSRHASKKGLETARDCADQIAREGAAIVSGYAHGVDMATHVAALEAGGTTIVVLAEGILNFKIKKELAHAYDPQKTLITSEFIPGLSWSIRNAMQRNATICGLSNLTILIEAQEKGGSFDAGGKCLTMGRPLFAPVYNGIPESATGNRILLEQGAFMIMKNKKTGRAHMQQVKDLLFGIKNGT